jgi:hypothetical protein
MEINQIIILLTIMIFITYLMIDEPTILISSPNKKTCNSIFCENPNI